MPLPGSQGAPFFDKTKPIELLRFIDQMEISSMSRKEKEIRQIYRSADRIRMESVQ